jgi:hypothetical protein
VAHPAFALLLLQLLRPLQLTLVRTAYFATVNAT